MSRRISGGVFSLKGWRTPVSLWAQSAYWSVREWFADQAEERPGRTKTVKLDVEPLEIRQMPSFALSLFSDAVADPIQGSVTAVGRTTVGLQDGNASMSLPVEYYQ